MTWHLLEVLGLLLLACGYYKQIWEEWIPRGLTDTSYSGLALFAAGAFVGAVVNFYLREWWLALTYLPMGGGAVYLIVRKAEYSVRRHFNPHVIRTHRGGRI